MTKDRWDEMWANEYTIFSDAHIGLPTSPGDAIFILHTAK